MGRNKHVLPDGWRDIQPIGQPIPGTRFIAFKVPLKGNISQALTSDQRFTPQHLNAAVKALNVELGLIIDLTNTKKYNYVKDLPKSVEYKKLVTVGFKVPDDATILQFKKWVRRFLWENAENEKLIGVHCTFGINRTGYLICRYLIDVEGWDPKTAIQAFGEARGHHMSGICLIDLQTQPMRSNIGMDLWDAGDVVPSPNDTDGNIDRIPNEEYPRWRDIQPIGQPIPGTRFIAFKVPLKGNITQALTSAQKFTPQHLNAAVKALNMELGLIIDLTNTKKYSYVKDLPKSVEYKKLVTVGDKVPDDATILQFKKWVRRFLWKNAENEKLIGVHCTFGINRTGYLICRYLIDVEGWDPKTAIQAFGEARGHHMSGICLIDLQTQPMRSNIGMDLWDAGDVVPSPNDTDGNTDRIPNEEYPRGQPYLSQKQFPGTPLFHRDYGSDEEDYHRNCRSDCSEDCKKIGSSDEIIRGEKIRLAPYSSSPVYLSSSSHQEVSSIAVDCEREPQHEVTREMDQGKRLPVLIFDYNYGLPLNYIVKEDIAY